MGNPLILVRHAREPESLRPQQRGPFVPNAPYRNPRAGLWAHPRCAQVPETSGLRTGLFATLTEMGADLTVETEVDALFAHMSHFPETFDVEHTDAVFILDPAGQVRVVDEGMPKLSGRLAKPLRALLDSQGLHNMDDPSLPWTATEVVDDLDFLMNRDIPASAVPSVKPLSLAAARRQLARSPKALAAVHKQAGELLGGIPALTRRMNPLLLVKSKSPWKEPTEFGI